MTDISIRAPTDADIVWVALHLRAADRDELRRCGRKDMPRALMRAVDISDEAYCALIDGVTACLFGIAPGITLRNGTYGIPWLLGTELVTRHARDLMRLAPAMIARWRSSHGELCNLVDVQNGAAIRWLSHMGARFDPPRPWGERGEPFLLFTL